MCRSPSTKTGGDLGALHLGQRSLLTSGLPLRMVIEKPCVGLVDRRLDAAFIGYEPTDLPASP